MFLSAKVVPQLARHFALFIDYSTFLLTTAISSSFCFKFEAVVGANIYVQAFVTLTISAACEWPNGVGVCGSPQNLVLGDRRNFP